MKRGLYQVADTKRTAAQPPPTSRTAILLAKAKQVMAKHFPKGAPFKANDLARVIPCPVTRLCRVLHILKTEKSIKVHSRGPGKLVRWVRI